MADNTINGSSGDDLLQTPNGFETHAVYGGDGNDFIVDGGIYGTQDSFYGGAGNDIILAGSGNDIIDTGTGDDNATGSQGDDTFIVNDNFGTDSLDGGEVEENTGDVLDATGMTAGATFTFGVDITTSSGSGGGPPGTGGDGGGGPGGGETTETTVVGVMLEAGPGNTAEIIGVEHYFLGGGNDTVIDDSGDNTIDMGAGDDIFRITDGFGADTVYGGDSGEVIGDLIDGSAITPDVVVTFSGDGTGSFTDGTDTLVFDGIERVATGAGNDSIFGGIGDDSANGGAGDDIFVVGNNGGADFFDGGEGGETTGDTLDAAALTTGVTVIYTGDAATVSDGITTGGFANVEHVILGAGNDTITGGTSDESITANAGNDTFAVLDNFGNDTITLGAGQDTIDGTGLTTDATVDFTAAGDGTLTSGANTVTFTSAETVTTGAGNDTINHSTADENIATGAGDDTYNLADGFGNDTWDAGTGGETTGDQINATALSGDVSATFNNDGSGTLTDGTSTLSFQNVENLTTASGDDTITGSTGDETINTNDGDDTILIDDDFGNDVLDGGAGGESTGDQLDGSALNAGVTLTLTNAESGTISDGADTLSFAEIEDITLGSGNDTIFASSDTDTVNTGGGDDRIVLSDGFGAGTFDAGETGESSGDILDGSGLTDDVTLTLNSAGTGTLSDGANTASFAGIEQIQTGSGLDTATGSTGADTISLGTGDDTFIIADGFSDDSINFGEGGLNNGDTLDGSALTSDVTVTFTINENGTLSDGTDTITFENLENVVTGSGNDTVFGGTSGDDVSTGAGDDTFVVQGSFNDDVYDAGTGDDTLDASALTASQAATITLDGQGDGTLNVGGDSVTFTSVENVLTGSGDDQITGGTGDETVSTGSGDDIFIINDGFGTDVFDAGEFGVTQGDWLDGGALTGSATVNFSADEDGTLTVGGNRVTFTDVEIVETGTGNDRITGSAGNETVSTGDGDDRIDGNAGADLVFAGDGNDIITFADGDTIHGGADDDEFRLEDTGEASNGTITIYGGSETATGAGDVLRLGQLADMSTLSSTDDGTGSLSGSVTLKDGTLLNFQDIEDIQNIICFTPGTLIKTPHGPRDIATLRVGDMVRTRDNGAQPIRWIQSRTVPAVGRFAPIRLRAGVMPSQSADLLVSPQHRMLFQGYQAELLFGDREVLVPALHLVDGKDVTQAGGGTVTYIHMMFDAHEIVYANGAASESFHPGSVGLSAITDAAREELFSLFPALRSDPNGYGQTARRCLRQHETHLLSV